MISAASPTAGGEHQRAKQWRLDRGLSRQELADLSGYSVSAISCFERGLSAKGGPVDQYAWLRFKRICYSIELERRYGGSEALFPIFNWGA